MRTYCSIECQTKEWEAHQQTCEKPSKLDEANGRISAQLTLIIAGMEKMKLKTLFTSFPNCIFLCEYIGSDPEVKADTLCKLVRTGLDQLFVTLIRNSRMMAAHPDVLLKRMIWALDGMQICMKHKTQAYQIQTNNKTGFFATGSSRIKQEGFAITQSIWFSAWIQ